VLPTFPQSLPFPKARSAFPIRALLPLVLLFLFLTSVAGAAQITEYRVIRQPVTDAAGKLRFAVRSYKEDGVSHLLVVDADSFKTYDLPASAVHPAAASAAANLSSTPLMRALERYASAPFRLQNS
jgi:hypothetical protein